MRRLDKVRNNSFFEGGMKKIRRGIYKKAEMKGERKHERKEICFIK